MFTGGPRVEYTNCYRDDTLPVASCKLTVRDAVLVVTLEQWRGRLDELKVHVREWVAGQVNLQGLRTLPRRRRDPEWMRLWREANPGRRA